VGKSITIGLVRCGKMQIISLVYFYSVLSFKTETKTKTKNENKNKNENNKIKIEYL
jgi:hypothetical protein